MAKSKKLTFDELAKNTALFQKDIKEDGLTEEKITTEETVPVTEDVNTLKDNKISEKGKERNIFELIEQRNQIVTDKSNNLISVSDKAKEVIEYVYTALAVGKKEFVDALILDFYLTNKESIKKDAQRKIKNSEINI